MPHLFPGPGASRDDRILGEAETRTLLRSSLIVEEKLDGANVMIWLDESDRIQVAGRAGVGAIDRAGQLGPLRGWAAEHERPLRSALDGADALYAEWLWITHSIHYDRLPGFLVVLDLWSNRSGFLPLAARNEAAARSSLPTPPEIHRGTLPNDKALAKLFGPSRFGDEQREGLVLRQETGPPVAKLLAPGFSRVTDSEWRGSRPRNRLAPR